MTAHADLSEAQPLVFTLTGPDGQPLFALSEGIPERDLDLYVTPDGTLDAHEEHPPFVAAATAKAALSRLLFDAADRVQVTPELAADLPDHELGRWDADHAAVMAVYADVMARPERAHSDVDNALLWEIYGQWHRLGQIAPGRFASYLRDNTVDDAGFPLAAMGIEARTCGRDVYFTFAVELSPLRFFFAGGDDDLQRTLLGQAPEYRVELGPAPTDRNAALGEEAFALGLPRFDFSGPEGDETPSIHLFRAVYLALRGLVVMLSHEWADGVPNGPFIQFSDTFGDMPETAEVFAFTREQLRAFIDG